MIRFGSVLRHNGAYDDAIGYFEQLVHHAIITSDQESLAIAYHNIAMCQMGQHKSVEAVASLVKQKDIADLFHIEDLEADALHELGFLLLQEGQVWEAEECFSAACKFNYCTICLNFS